MSFDFNNKTPIYLQIIRHIKMQIISQKFLPNEKIPSVRDLALEFEVNPNTVQKALLELETQGLIYTERTNGKFVTNNLKIIEKTKTQIIKEELNTFYKTMSKLGLSTKEIFETLLKEDL